MLQNANASPNQNKNKKQTKYINILEITTTIKYRLTNFREAETSDKGHVNTP